MQRVDFSTVIKGIADLVGEDPENLGRKYFAKMRRMVNRRLRFGWQFSFWADLCLTEKRYIKEIYSSSQSYSYGDFVYYPATEKFYQHLAVATSSGTVPTTLTKWAEAVTVLTVADFNAWSVATAYGVGDQVYYSAADSFYQCIFAHTGTTPGTNPARWALLLENDLVLSREQTGQTKIGTVIEVYSQNPRILRRAATAEFGLAPDGFKFYAEWKAVWVEFRLKVPELTGEVWDAAETYAVGDQVYFSGNFYNCIVTTTVTQGPETTAASWELVEIPAFLEAWLVQSCYADWLRPEKDEQGSAMEENQAAGLLIEAAGVESEQSGQARRLVVLSR